MMGLGATVQCAHMHKFQHCAQVSNCTEQFACSNQLQMISILFPGFTLLNICLVCDEHTVKLGTFFLELR